MIKRIFDLRGAPLLLIAFGILLVAERKKQLRKRNQPQIKRGVINSIVAIPSFSLLRLVFIPAMVRLALHNRKMKLGLNYQYNTHPLLKTIISFLALDYTNYLWHVLNHKIPLLWRFHVVHHSDPDLDITTAFRFHFGELIGSVFFRVAAVLATGATAMQVLIYEILFEGATQFHHSNWKLPYKLEKNLNKVIVTPRMHGIHHSMIRQETDSNYSVIFSWWDRLHKTVRLNVPQEMIVIGVPSYSNTDELTAGYLLKLPFTKIRGWEQVNEIRDVRGTEEDKNDLAE
jgi:sterol desaturase/sphingolipid hydroxylase (fatty acid hydroxylase superfamily)